MMKVKKLRGLLEVTFTKPLVMVKTASGLKIGVRRRYGVLFHNDWVVSKNLKKGKVILGEGWRCKLGIGQLLFKNKKFFGDGCLFLRSDAVKEVRNLRTGITFSYSQYKRAR